MSRRTSMGDAHGNGSLHKERFRTAPASPCAVPADGRVLGDASTFAVAYLAKNERGTDYVIVRELLPRTVAGRARDEERARLLDGDATRGAALQQERVAAADEARLQRARRRVEARVQDPRVRAAGG